MKMGIETISSTVGQGVDKYHTYFTRVLLLNGKHYLSYSFTYNAELGSSDKF
jgi:hypothetical protein